MSNQLSAFEQFHDGFFEGIWIPSPCNALVYLATVERRRSTAALTGVKMLRLTDFKEGNIILEVHVRTGDMANQEDIASLYDLPPRREPAQWELDLLNDLKRERLILFEIDCSYGADCLILAETVKLENRGPDVIQLNLAQTES